MIPDSFSYDGTEKKPTVLVTYQYGTEVEVRQLTEGSDFTVAYSNNINAGTATAVISGIGNYTDTKSVSFQIVEKPKQPTAPVIEKLDTVNITCR